MSNGTKNDLKVSLVVGAGEVGKSLYRVIRKTYKADMIDRGGETYIEGLGVDVLHICIPWSKEFIKSVKEYIKQFDPKATVIHSTVPVGTTEKLGSNVFHSPIRGKHPHLDKGITTFTKDVGGKNRRLGKLLEKYFRKAGIPTKWRKSSRDTELAKIMCTTYYGWVICFCKEMEKLCKKHNTSFNFVYKQFNEDYNDGYVRLGEQQYRRPILKAMKGPIGGHCVINNCYLDKNKITREVLKMNKTYEI